MCVCVVSLCEAFCISVLVVMVFPFGKYNGCMSSICCLHLQGWSYKQEVGEEDITNTYKDNKGGPISNLPPARAIHPDLSNCKMCRWW